jgi:hypothetical protein
MVGERAATELLGPNESALRRPQLVRGTGGRSDDRRGDPRRPGPGHARRCLERASMWTPVVAEARVPGQSSSCAHVSSVRRLPGTARSGRRHSCGRHECRPGCSLADEEGFRGTRGNDHLFHHAAGAAASGGISFFLLSGSEAPLCGAVELTARYPTSTCVADAPPISWTTIPRTSCGRSGLRNRHFLSRSGRPKQEAFCVRHRDALRLRTCGLFTFLSGEMV